jgi:hypothetical protein
VILPDSEVERLTGYKRPSDQISWLQRNGWRFTVNALGWPRVAVAEFHRRMVGGRATSQEPNWGALDGAQAHAR